MEAQSKQKFIIRLQAIGKLMVKYRKEEWEGPAIDSSLPEAERKALEKKREKKAFRLEREDVAHAFYERIRQLILGSDIQRLRAKLDLRKEMMKDYKEKYEKVMQ